MALDLEIAGAVRELSAGETTQAAEPRKLAKLRESHQQVARLFAKGLRPQQIATQTGYALSRLSTLQNDPAFCELVAWYKQSNDDAIINVEARMLGVALDALQAWHEEVLDGNITDPGELREMAKTMFDRAGFAPVQRTINKNLNLNLAKRMDEKLRDKEEAA